MFDVSCRVADVRAVSFQQVPLKFSIVKMDAASTNVFSLHQNGELYLLKKLRHVSDPQQYKMEIKVKEEYTNLETTTQVMTCCWVFSGTLQSVYNIMLSLLAPHETDSPLPLLVLTFPNFLN